MIWKKPSSRGPDDKKPMLIGLITLIGLVLAILAQSVFGNTRSDVEPTPLQAVAPTTPAVSQPVAPSALQSAIEMLGSAEQGRNGILVRSVEDDWVAGYRGATTFSQGTTRRIWLGAALLEAVDYGEISLEQRVPLLAVKRNGGQPREQVGELLRRAVAGDDRRSQDHILDGLSGPAGMARWLEEKGLDEIAYGPANRDLARNLGGKGAQETSHPLDGATPDGMAFGLSRIFAGKLLSDSSTQILLGYFTRVPVKAGGTEPGWQILRMTGETASAGGQVLGANGVALVRSGSGRRFTVAVFAEGRANAIVRRDRLLSGALTALEQTELR